jgi:UDP-N-acetylglucosamine acyltransferase
MSTISKLAIIQEGAIIGKNVTIAPFCHISADSIIGDDTIIEQGACIYGKTKIGKRNKIYSYAVLGSEPQDLKFQGEDVELIIGDDNMIREFTLINPGTEGGGSKTIIGDHNLIMGHVHLAHDVILHDHIVLVNSVIIAGHVEIFDNVVVGGMSAIHQFVKIGEYAMIGGASAVAQDIPPYCLCEGNRAVLRGLNNVGLRRKIGRDTIDILKKSYKEIFASGKPMKEVADTINTQTDNEHIKKLTQFVMDTTRGIPVKREEKR